MDDVLKVAELATRRQQEWREVARECAAEDNHESWGLASAAAHEFGEIAARLRAAAGRGIGEVWVIWWADSSEPLAFATKRLMDEYNCVGLGVHYKGRAWVHGAPEPQGDPDCDECAKRIEYEALHEALEAYSDALERKQGEVDEWRFKLGYERENRMIDRDGLQAQLKEACAQADVHKRAAFEAGEEIADWKERNESLRGALDEKIGEWIGAKDEANVLRGRVKELEVAFDNLGSTNNMTIKLQGQRLAQLTEANAALIRERDGAVAELAVEKKRLAERVSCDYLRSLCDPKTLDCAKVENGTVWILEGVETETGLAAYLDEHEARRNGNPPDTVLYRVPLYGVSGQQARAEVERLTREVERVLGDHNDEIARLGCQVSAARAEEERYRKGIEALRSNFSRVFPGDGTGREVLDDCLRALLEGGGG
jgi:hypothetical protein